MEFSLLQALVNNHIIKCRFCLTQFGSSGKNIQITKAIESRLMELTGIELQHSPAFSNAICEKCDKELMNFSIFQQDVRAKQNFLNDHVNGTTLKNEFIKVEPCEEVFGVELEEAVGAKVEDDSYFQDNDAASDVSSSANDESQAWTAQTALNGDPAPCPECGEVLSDKYCLKRHVKAKHEELFKKLYASNPKTDPSRTCSICDKQFFDKNNLKRHTKAKHKKLFKELFGDEPKSAPKSKTEPSEGKTPLKICCTVCGGFFERKYYTEHFRRVHDKSKIFRCDLCPKLSYSKKHVNEHMKRHISRDLRRTFPCNQCDSVFFKNSARKIHFRDKHENPGRVFDCAECSKRFYTQKTMESHFKLMHGERTFKCEFCQKFYFTERILQNHIALSHNSSRYLCPQCGNDFSSAAAVRDHIANIHQERKYKCEHAGCGRMFAFEWKLKTHIKQHSEGKKFHCEHPNCGKSYFQIQRLRMHVRVVHEQVRGGCPIADCKFTSARYDQMRCHVLKHGGMSEEEKQRMVQKVRKMDLA